MTNETDKPSRRFIMWAISITVGIVIVLFFIGLSREYQVDGPQAESDRKALEHVQLCETAKATLGNRPLGSLTFNERELLESCAH